jgi:hypothetical protein
MRSVFLNAAGLYKIRGAWRSMQEPAFFSGAGSGEPNQQSSFLQIN